MTKHFVSEAQLALSTEAEAAKAGAIEAMLTTWGAREGADGRRFNYQPQPFVEWYESWKAEGRPLPMYFQHDDQSIPVGQWEDFEFTDTGMKGVGRMFTSTTQGRDLYQIMKESPALIGGVSVGVYADEWCMVDESGMETSDYEGGYFSVTRGGLAEVSIVMQPNNPMAEIQRLEFFHPDGNLNLKAFEKALREAGFSKMDATKAASVFGSAAKREVMPAPQPTTERRDADADAATTDLLKALEQRALVKALEAKLQSKVKETA